MALKSPITSWFEMAIVTSTAFVAVPFFFIKKKTPLLAGNDLHY